MVVRFKETSFHVAVDERRNFITTHKYKNIKASGTKNRHFSIIIGRGLLVNIFPASDNTIETERRINKSQGSTVTSIIPEVSEHTHTHPYIHTHSATNLEMPTSITWKCTLSIKVLKGQFTPKSKICLSCSTIYPSR